MGKNQRNRKVLLAIMMTTASAAPTDTTTIAAVTTIDTATPAAAPAIAFCCHRCRQVLKTIQKASNPDQQGLSSSIRLQVMDEHKCGFFFNLRDRFFETEFTFAVIFRCEGAFVAFLDASSHLITRLCPSVGRLVGRSLTFF